MRFSYELTRESGGKPNGIFRLAGSVECEAISCGSTLVRDHLIEILRDNDTPGSWKAVVSAGRGVAKAEHWFSVATSVVERKAPEPVVKGVLA